MNGSSGNSSQNSKMTRSTFSAVGRLLAVLSTLFLSFLASAQTTSVDRTNFTATITSFQSYLKAYPRNVHLIAATVHFQNKTKKPLILGYDRKGFTASDEQGNRYALTFIRGMGEAAGSTVDAKFVLPPQEGADMLCEFAWQQSANAIFGITFDLNMAVRELKKLQGSEYQLGPESTLEFVGLKTNYVRSLEGAVDLEGHSTSAGPFKAQLVRSKFGKSGRWETVGDFTLKLENTSTRPLILACEPYSIFGNDNEGVIYGGSNRVVVTGIGLAKDNEADPQFVLAPGESKEIHLTIYKGEHVPLGTIFNLYLGFEELQITPSKQIVVLRQYTLTLPRIDMK